MARLDNVLYLIGCTLQRTSISDPQQVVDDCYDLYSKIEAKEQTLAAEEKASYAQTQMALAQQRAESGGGEENIPFDSEAEDEGGELGEMRSY